MDSAGNGIIGMCYTCGRCSNCCKCNVCPCCGKRIFSPYQITYVGGGTAQGYGYPPGTVLCNHKE